jgi:hypothetical protein
MRTRLRVGGTLAEHGESSICGAGWSEFNASEAVRMAKRQMVAFVCLLAFFGRFYGFLAPADWRVARIERYSCVRLPG